MKKNLIAMATGIFVILLLQMTADLRAQGSKGQMESDDPALIKEGMMLFKQGRFDESEKVFKQILNGNTNSLISKEMLAIISYKNKDYAQAQKYAEKSLEQNRRSAKAHLVMAGIYREKKNMLAAKDHLRKAKKYITPREKETVEKFISEENKRMVAQVEAEPTGEKDRSPIPEVKGEKPTLAVFAFEDTGDEESDIGKSVSEMLITGLIQTNQFQVIERSQLDHVLEEQALGQSGALDEETAADVGNLLGVDAIVIGSVSTLKPQIEIDARLVNPGSGKSLSAANVSAANNSQLRTAVNNLAAKLAAEAGKIPLIREDSK
jgi:TolB-like protein